ncbi:MAG: 2-phosphosulfolactate phosphatase [Ardenticatenaceae bacterium]
MTIESRPQLKILHGISGAKQATGLAVVIDVFRAFSVACYAFEQGVERIIPVADVETAFQLKEQMPDVVLVGERKGRKIAGFDMGNSPTAILKANLSGKTMVHTTSNGTQGIANAKQATQIMTGSFVNAKAIADYIRTNAISDVSLVCMGNGSQQAIEDTLCAEYIRDLVAGQPTNVDHIRETIRRSQSASRFFDPTREEAPESDLELCLDANRYPFVLPVQPDDQHTPLKVTRRKGHDFVVIGADDSEREQETLYVLQNRYLMDQITNSLQTLSTGKGYSPTQEQLNEILSV